MFRAASPSACAGLSIIDLVTGHQPISNEDGTIWIVFNGEIYNFYELRDDLVARGHTFQTQTDTEVNSSSLRRRGRSCVERLRGMFGFAIWDSRERKLFLARDRVGEKPLHYSLAGDTLIFGSEIKSILQHPADRARGQHRCDLRLSIVRLRARPADRVSRHTEAPARPHAHL